MAHFFPYKFLFTKMKRWFILQITKRNVKKETVTSRPASLTCYRIPNEAPISDSSSSPRDKTT